MSSKDTLSFPSIVCEEKEIHLIGRHELFPFWWLYLFYLIFLSDLHSLRQQHVIKTEACVKRIMLSADDIRKTPLRQELIYVFCRPYLQYKKRGTKIWSNTLVYLKFILFFWHFKFSLIKLVCFIVFTAKLNKFNF